jgi:hypothetical protein
LAGGVGEADLMAGNRSAGRTGSSDAPSSAPSFGSAEAAEAVPFVMQMNKPRHSSPHTRGQDWAIHGKAPTSGPVGRPIRVVVRSDRLVIQPDVTQAHPAAMGKEIRLDGPTVENLDEFVAAIQDRVHDWGIAGNGLYWRPVLLLSIEPDGQGRAHDLARLLRNSGIELDDEETATKPREAQSHATR